MDNNTERRETCHYRNGMRLLSSRSERSIEYRRLTNRWGKFFQTTFLQKTVFEKEKDIKKEYLSIPFANSKSRDGTIIQNLPKRIFYYYTTTILLYYFYTIIQNLAKRIFQSPFRFEEIHDNLPLFTNSNFYTKFQRNVQNDTIPSSLFLPSKKILIPGSFTEFNNTKIG